MVGGQRITSVRVEPFRQHNLGDACYRGSLREDFTAQGHRIAHSVSTNALLSLIINGPGLSVITSSLPAGTVGVAYSQPLNATGGMPPYTWSISSGSLPGGFGLAGNTISGTPTTAGSSSFTVRVTDSASSSATAALSLTIIAPALNITTSAFPPGMAGTGYSQAVNATGGTPPYTWSVASGSLPAGLSLAGGIISGTPVAAGSSSFTIKVTDSVSASASAALSLAINAPVLSITTSSLPPGSIGAAYSQGLNASGGSPPYTWSLATGSFPPGLGLAGGVISGTPTIVGSSSFTIRVTDSASVSATSAFSLQVTPPVLTITTLSLPPGSVGTAYSQPLIAAGGCSPPYAAIAGRRCVACLV